jgi:hypothetical protein
MFQMFGEELAGRSSFGIRLVLASATYSGILPGIKRGSTMKAELEGEMLPLSARRDSAAAIVYGLPKHLGVGR